MRQQLREIDGQRQTFTGTFDRFGTKNSYGYIKYTILLKDIKDINGEVVADHLWFNLTKEFGKFALESGDVLRFDARVKDYLKGYFGYREDVYKPIQKDYRLSHPTKVQQVLASS